MQFLPPYSPSYQRQRIILYAHACCLFQQKKENACVEAHMIRHFSSAHLPFSSPCARRQYLNQLHLGKLSPSSTTYVSVELLVTSPSFFEPLIIAPLPIIKHIPECTFPSMCTAWATSMNMHTYPSSSIDTISGTCVFNHECPDRCLNLLKSLHVGSFSLA